MRRVRYAVAMSLDGYIAGPNGESDWIIHDPDIDFNEIFARFDTLLIGRKTFEAMLRMGDGGGSMPGVKSFVLSRTMKQGIIPMSRSRETLARSSPTSRPSAARISGSSEGGAVQEPAGCRTGGRCRRRGRPGAAWWRHSTSASTRTANEADAHEPAGVREVGDRRLGV